jgi:hypothetical protein
MEEEPALEPLASAIPGCGEPMEWEDDASELVRSDDAALQQSGSPFSSTSDAAAVPGDIGHASTLDPGLHDSQPTRNGVEEEATMQSDEALQDMSAGMVPLGQGGNAAPDSSELPQLTADLFFELAVQMFARGADASVAFVLKAFGVKPTIEICALVKQAVHRLYESKVHRATICRSPERTDLRLSQEEALGYLLGAALGVELLPEEVRVPPPGSGGIGRQVDYFAGEEKKASERAKASLKSKRKGAKDAAVKSGGAAAALEAKLAAIDADAEASRAERRAMVCPIKLPDRTRTKICDVKRKPPPPPLAATASQLRTKVERAEAAVVRADADAAAACRRSEKADEALAKLTTKRLENAVGGWRLDDDEAWEQLQAERAEMDQEHAQLMASAAQLRRELMDSHIAADDARFAAQEARDDVAAAAREAKWEAQQAVWKQQDAEREAAREVERAAEAAVELELQAREDEMLKAFKQELAQRRAECERESRELHREIARSQWAYSRPEVVRDHAAKIWGWGREKENSAPPKVFRLVGKSVDEVRSLAPDVSQVVTGTEERVRLNRMQHEMLL